MNYTLHVFSCVIRTVSLGYAIYFIVEILILALIAEDGGASKAPRWTGDTINDLTYIALSFVVAVLFLAFMVTLVMFAIYLFFFMFIWRGLFQKKNDVFTGIVVSIGKIFRFFFRTE